MNDDRLLRWLIDVNFLVPFENETTISEKWMSPDKARSGESETKKYPAKPR